MLPAVVLDAVSFWLFEQEDTSEDWALEVVERALAWLKPDPSAGFGVIVSQASIERLEKLGMFPAEPYFARILKDTNLDHVVSPKQLAAAVARFLATATIFEETQEITDAIFNSVVVEPNLCESIAADQLRDITLDLIGLTALNNVEVERLMYAFSSHAGTYEALSVAVDASVLEFRCEEKKFPQITESRVRLLRRPHEFFDRLEPEEIWAGAENADEIKLAIELEALRLGLISGRTMKSFTVGNRFLSSLASFEASERREYASVVRNKCAQIVADAGNVEVSDFHTSTKRIAVRTRVSDKARAQRVHITNKHQGLRLMFWLKADRSIEFANVGNKMDEQILD